MLRWVSPIKNMCRTVTHDTEFMGQQLLAGPEVHAAVRVGEPRRDEVRRPAPLRRRAHPNEHVAFGFGAHFCLGQALARLELTCDVRAVAHPPPRPRARRSIPSTFPRRPRQLHQRPRVDAASSSLRSRRTIGAWCEQSRISIAQFWTDLYARDWDEVGDVLRRPTRSTPTCRPRLKMSRGAPEQIVARLRLGLEPLASIGHVLVKTIVVRGRHGRHRTRRALGVAAPARRSRCPFVSMQETARRRIVRWWDYWDLGTLMGSAPAWWVEHIMEAAAAAGLGEG